MHLDVYAATAGTAVSTCSTSSPALHYYVLQLGAPVRVACYATYGIPELARSVRAALQDRTAALMQNHGAVAHGATLGEANDRARLLEWLCALHVTATGIGMPRVLTGDELARRRTEVPA